MTDKEFLRIFQFLKNRYGINAEKRKNIVEARLENYVKNRGFSSYTAYMDAVEADCTKRLERDLVDMLTTNHTFFMREPEHFDFLRHEVLPWLYEHAKKTGNIYVWCGACATGEEAYTIAMMLSEYFALEEDRFHIKIYATDISTEALARAKSGVYHADRIAQLPASYRHLYFSYSKKDDTYTVKKELIKGLAFRKFNLMDPMPFSNMMQVVFLRNVMIYFDAPTKKRLLEKVYDLLVPGGYLFIGTTEIIDMSGLKFKTVQKSVYRKPV